MAQGSPPRHIGTGTFRATPRMRELVGKVLDSGRISYGPLSMRLEREFAALHGCRYGVLSNSGTSSLHVALQALKETDGWADWDEVIVPAVTFVATVNVVIHNRLRPVFVDVETGTYGIDPDLVGRAVTARTRAVIPAHLFGQPCDLDGIMAAVELRKDGIRVIEDACETCFATHNGRVVGSMGDIACFSFYNAHIITAGVGGMATANDPELARKMRSLVNHGLDIAELNVDENFSPRPATGRSFRFSHAGHSYRITEMEAALAMAQLEQWEMIVHMRQRNARHLAAGLAAQNGRYDAELRLPAVADGNTHSWMMFPLLIEGGGPDKDELTRFLNGRGIETRDMMPITDQPIYAGMLLPQDYPVADWINRSGFYIGCHQDLSPDDIQYVVDCFEEFSHTRRVMVEHRAGIGMEA